MSPRQFQFVSLFPELLEQVFSWGVIGQARKRDLLQMQFHNPRSWATDLHKTVDDRPFGGGDGMLMMAEPLGSAISHAKGLAPRARCVCLSAQGRVLTDAYAQDLAREDLIVVCGRYAGIDERVLVHFGIEEVSIGDYVLSGGEIAAAVLIDVVARQIPGVLGHADSADRESFRNGLLECPQFTRPREVWGLQVPEVLLSGHHQRIEAWQSLVSWITTFQKRPDLFEQKIKSMSGSEVNKLVKDLEKFMNGLSQPEKTVLGVVTLSSKELLARIAAMVDPAGVTMGKMGNK